MKLFLVERTDGCDYDEHDSAIIRAESEEEVISKLFNVPEKYRESESFQWYINDNDGDVDEAIADVTRLGRNQYGLDGFTRNHTKITELTYDGEPGIVLSSFNAG